MRIHTSLFEKEMLDVLKNSGAPIAMENLTVHNSRTHDRAFEATLSGSGGRPGGRRSKGYQVATWDEWGAFFGALYDADPDARCGGSASFPVYRNAEHFHLLTSRRFLRQTVVEKNEWVTTYLPTDAHARHQWRYTGPWDQGGNDGFRCASCSAVRPTMGQAKPYAPRAYA